ncbi:MAG: hypothetical protein M3Z02_01365 [Actinomycetota bacterium]|nr:hypothetical protein [Actinomycetota bacterium]
MSENAQGSAPSAAREAGRSELLPEETTAGSEAPAGQAAAILADSDERMAEAADGPGADVEHRKAGDLT